MPTPSIPDPENHAPATVEESIQDLLQQLLDLGSLGDETGGVITGWVLAVRFVDGDGNTDRRLLEPEDQPLETLVGLVKLLEVRAQSHLYDELERLEPSDEDEDGDEGIGA